MNEAMGKARQIAERIVSGKLEPYDGAMMIWKQILVHLERNRIPDALWPCLSCASAIEDCLWNASDSGSNHDATIASERRTIMQAAVALVESSP